MKLGRLAFVLEQVSGKNNIRPQSLIPGGTGIKLGRALCNNDMCVSREAGVLNNINPDGTGTFFTEKKNIYVNYHRGQL